MAVVMIKKRLASGEPCRKCVQSEELLKSRGLWDAIDEVVWADEGDPESAGMVLARRHGIETAPFYVVDDETVYPSTLRLIREVLAPRAKAAAAPPAAPAPIDVAAAARDLEGAGAPAIIRWALETLGPETAVAFSGAEDVVLIHLAAATGLPFVAVTIDTGRLHPETYEFLEAVRERYDLTLQVLAPAAADVEALVSTKGLFSFYRDGHAECCDIRKVRPLARALAGRPGWITGQRRDQSDATRAGLAAIESDPVFAAPGETLVKVNPLAAWTSDRVWAFIRDNDIPYNPLHARGFASIGCAPCTRPILPGQSARDGRWWWERAEKKECGLHAGNLPDEADATLLRG